MLTGRKILLGITGSIAAYKSILLLRLLVKQGAEVKVLMTPAAADFVSPLVLATLSKHQVLTDIADGSTWANHVMLGRWADVMIITPATCNSMAKMATGICDNLLMATYLSATCPVMIAPAMDEDMWNHPSTKTNVRTLISYGNILLQPGSGELASGLIGEGRMAEPEEIFEQLSCLFIDRRPLQGSKVLITAGPTYEPIDPVRFIGNHSTGKMGLAIAKAFSESGADIHLVLGPSTIQVPPNIKLFPVQTAQEMFDKCNQLFAEMDIAIMTAAVADYRPLKPASDKIKKTDGNLSIELALNPDILKHCGSIKKATQILVGFALETNNEEANAQEKLQRKNADMIVLNSLNDEQSGFGTDTNKVSIFEKNGMVHRLPLQSKAEVASKICDIIIEKWHEIKN